MKAKLINEILRGKESAISSLGIGKISLTKTYDHIRNSIYPSIIDYSVELDEAKLPEEIKDRISIILNTDSSNIIGISDFQLLSPHIEGISADFEHWLESIENHNNKTYETHNIDENRYIIKTPYVNEWDIIRVRSFTIEPKYAPKELLEQCYVFFRI